MLEKYTKLYFNVYNSDNSIFLFKKFLLSYLKTKHLLFGKQNKQKKKH